MRIAFTPDFEQLLARAASSLIQSKRNIEPVPDMDGYFVTHLDFAPAESLLGTFVHEGQEFAVYAENGKA